MGKRKSFIKLEFMNANQNLVKDKSGLRLI